MTNCVQYSEWTPGKLELYSPNFGELEQLIFRESYFSMLKTHGYRIFFLQIEMKIAGPARQFTTPALSKGYEGWC
jgi:hypothetical protein